jgi:hypothetical protein
MASLVGNDVNAVVVGPIEDGSVSHRAVADRAGVARINAALPARSATLVRIAGLAVLCAATLVAPALLLVWMPIVLGVPHVASDIRFLVLPLPRKQVALAVGACVTLVVLKAASLVTGISFLRTEMIVVASWLLGMLALEATGRRSHALARHVAARSNAQPSVVAWIATAVAAMAIIVLPIQFAFIAAIAHNFVAIVAWVVVKQPARRHALAVIAAIAAAVVVLVLAGPAVSAFTGGASSPWLTVDKAAGVMFGGLPLEAARALIIAFAFLQAVHYAIWLEWIPRGAEVGRMPTKPWLLVTASTIAVIAAALVDAKWARTTYLALATFHIYLEVVILAARAARRRA